MSDESKGCMRKARRRLERAREDLRDEAYESCVHNAYYSAYWSARACLMLRRVHPRTHEGLISMFGLHFIKSSEVDKRYGRILNFLKDLRMKANYEALDQTSRGEAEEAVRDAEEFLEMASKIVTRQPL